MFPAQKYEEPECKKKIKHFSKLTVFGGSFQEVFCKRDVLKNFP